MKINYFTCLKCKTIKKEVSPKLRSHEYEMRLRRCQKYVNPLSLLSLTSLLVTSQVEYNKYPATDPVKGFGLSSQPAQIFKQFATALTVFCIFY